MSIRVTELTFLEHFASRYNISVPRFVKDAEDVSRIKTSLESFGGKGIVKPDVLTGKRGKAGGINVVSSLNEALTGLKKVSSTQINGKFPRIGYMVEMIPAQFEMFSAITYNSFYKAPSITISLAGGVDIEEVSENKKITRPIDVFEGLDAYEASQMLAELGCETKYISRLSRALVNFWELFINTGMQTAEINPWRITPAGVPYACDFKATIDESNKRVKALNIDFPTYPENKTEFEEEMNKWSLSSHQGQAHVSDMGGKKVLPMLFGGGASTMIIETLETMGAEPMFLSDFGGNPPYERMYGTALRCFKHKLKDAKLVLILGGKANNTDIDITLKAIGDALEECSNQIGGIDIPIVVGRGGKGLSEGFLHLKGVFERLKVPFAIFGPDTPVTKVADYAGRLVMEKR